MGLAALDICRWRTLPQEEFYLLVTRLPGLVSQSVLLWDQSRVEMRRAARGHTEISLLPEQVRLPISVSSPPADVHS